MKKHLYVAILLGISASTARAQTTPVTVDGNDVVNSNAKLVIVTGNGQSFFTGHQAGSGYTFPTGIFRAITDNPNGQYNYFFDGLIGGTTNFSIRADGQGYFAGRMGIGTTSPQAWLDISHPATNQTTAILARLPEGGDGTYLGIKAYDSQPNAAIPNVTDVKSFAIEHSFYGVLNSSINFLRGGNTSGGSIAFNTNANQEQMRILYNGNVGIGTTTPQAKLQLQGTLLTGSGMSNIDPNPNNPQGNLSYLANSAQMLIGWNRNAGDGETDFVANQGAGTNGGFAFFNYDNSNSISQLLRVRGNGEVLIGVNNYLAGIGANKLAVGGGIIAESVTVKLQSGGWPDYVFKPSYHLRSLGELKTYVEQNHHLPEMPSAEQVEKEGQSLGEMNKVLLQKVEELTLYLLEKDKQLQQQGKQLKHLNAVVRTLVNKGKHQK